MLDFNGPEGSTPYTGDISDLKPKHIRTLGELNEYESNNIMLAQEWIIKHQRNFSTEDILNIDFIKKLHEKMFNKTWKWAGKFRTENLNIGVKWSMINEELRKLLDNVYYWIENQTYNPNEIGIRFHHCLVKIHLFPNGNGRHSRLITDILLQNLNCQRFSWGKESDLFKESETRKQYIIALKEADKHNYEQLKNFLLPPSPHELNK